MPGTPTPNYGWPIPALTDPPDGPAQIGALGNAIDTTLKAQIGAASVGFTPTWAGLTVGNGIQGSYYRLLGSHAAVYFTLSAAAGSPTTAFTTADCTLSIPFTGRERVFGTLFFGGWPQRAGFCFAHKNNSVIVICALRASDACWLAPGTIWGTTPWPANTELSGSILIPI